MAFVVIDVNSVHAWIFFDYDSRQGKPVDQVADFCVRGAFIRRQHQAERSRFHQPAQWSIALQGDALTEGAIAAAQTVPGVNPMADPCAHAATPYHQLDTVRGQAPCQPRQCIPSQAGTKVQGARLAMGQ